MTADNMTLLQELAKDSELRRAFFEDPQAVLAERGIELSSKIVETLHDEVTRGLVEELRARSPVAHADIPCAITGQVSPQFAQAAQQMEARGWQQAAIQQAQAARNVGFICSPATTTAGEPENR